MRNVEKILRLQNQRLQAAKRLSKSNSEDEKQKLNKSITDTGEQIKKLNTKDPKAAKRLKELLKNLPNVPTSCECTGHHHHH